MSTYKTIFCFALLSLTVACGGSEQPPPKQNTTPPKTDEKKRVDVPVQCKKERCAPASILNAIPTNRTVKIQLGAAMQQSSGLRQQSLKPQQEGLSDGYEGIVEYVTELNGVLGDTFEEIEQLASNEPEETTETSSLWRKTHPTDAENELLLFVETQDEKRYDIWLVIVPAGSEFSKEQTALEGHVVLDDNGTKQSFELVTFFGQDDDQSMGQLNISAEPFEDGLWHLTYDLESMSEEHTDIQLTDYWVFDEDNGALEYSYYTEAQDQETGGQIYARWDNEGGRLDNFVEAADSETNTSYQVVSTYCWSALGMSTFEGHAVALEEGYYAEVEGDEQSCQFVVMEGHPSPIDAIANIFENATWQSISESAEPFPDSIDYNDPYDEENPPTNTCEDHLDTVEAAYVVCFTDGFNRANLCETAATDIAECAQEVEQAQDSCAPFENENSVCSTIKAQPQDTTCENDLDTVEAAYVVCFTDGFNRANLCETASTDISECAQEVEQAQDSCLPFEDENSACFDFGGL